MRGIRSCGVLGHRPIEDRIQIVDLHPRPVHVPSASGYLSGEWRETVQEGIAEEVGCMRCNTHRVPSLRTKIDENVIASSLSRRGRENRSLSRAEVLGKSESGGGFHSPSGSRRCARRGNVVRMELELLHRADRGRGGRRELLLLRAAKQGAGWNACPEQPTHLPEFMAQGTRAEVAPCRVGLLRSEAD